jgi:hypothetical protein
MATVPEQLEKQVRTIEQLRKLPHDNPELYKWRDETHDILRKQFGPISSQIRQFDSIVFRPTTFGLGMPETYFVSKYQKGLDTAETFLKQLVEQLNSESPSSKVANIPSPQQALSPHMCPAGHMEIDFLDVYELTSTKTRSDPQNTGNEIPTPTQTARGYRCKVCQVLFYVVQK